MQRRRFLTRVAAAGAAAITGAGLGGCQREEAATGADKKAARFDWKMVTTWPPNFPIFQEGVVRFAKDVKTMSGGRLNIHVFAGGELVPPLETFDAVSQGNPVQIGHGAGYYWAGKIPAAQFFTAVPFGMNAQGMSAWMYSGGGLELYQEVYKPFNLVPFPLGNTGVQMGGWFRRKINTVDDLRGLKMRIPGLGGKTMAKAGVTPVLLPGGEIYTALERGLIDATEWVGPYHDERLGLYRAAKYYYYPGWQEPGPMLELIVNLKAWESLPEDLRLIVKNAAMATSLWMFAEFEAKNQQALETLRNKYKVEILEFPPEVLKALRKHANAALEEEAAKDATFKRVYEAYSAFRKNHDAWSGYSERAYADTLRL